MKTEGKKINWANAFEYNEELHFAAQNIGAKYAMLAYNNATNPLAKEWEQKGLEWSRYDRAIKELVFDTREDAEVELVKLRAAYHEVIAMEKLNLTSERNAE